MSDELPLPGQSDDEIQALAQMVADNLAEGESPDEIAKQLVDTGGWKLEDAHGFVESIQLRMLNTQHASSGSGGGEGMGWLVWIGAIVLINALSYVFNWGFWIY